MARRLKVVAKASMALAIVGLIAVSVLMAIQVRDARQRDALAAEYLAAARQGVVSLMSLNYATAQADVQRIIDNSTGQFRTDFASTAADFAEVTADSKVVSEATVAGTAVDSMTADNATVLVVVTSRITDSAGGKEDPRTWRLSVEVSRDGDRVKLAKVDFIP